jgi:hypothetical protein
MKYDLIGENESKNELHFLWEICKQERNEDIRVEGKNK